MLYRKRQRVKIKPSVVWDAEANALVFQSTLRL